MGLGVVLWGEILGFCAQALLAQQRQQARRNVSHLAGLLQQAQAAQRFGIAQSRVSDLVRGKWDKFSLDMLITLAARAGRKVELALHA